MWLSTAKSSTSVSYVKIWLSSGLLSSPASMVDSGAADPCERAWYDSGPLMLRAALVGFGSSGKTTLFQLMTSAKETGRAAHGKGDVSIGISKVPDARLDRLTAMYNPRKRVPATVEFTDLAAGGAAGAKGPAAVGWD